MNQALRERFYSQGNKKHIDYVVRVSGMNEQEAELFRMLHNGADDLMVESTLCIDRKRRSQLEKMVAQRVSFAVLHALDFCIANEPV